MKKNLILLNLVCVCTGILLHSKLSAQSLPVGTPVLEDYYRRMQLLGKVDSNLSFTIRPIYPQANNPAVDSVAKISTRLFGLQNNQVELRILPLTWQQQINTDHPYSWNDGAMIPAKGYQTMVSGGFYIKAGFLSVQFKPEVVYAANTYFNGFGANRSDNDLRDYHTWHNLIDAPERFGNGSYNKFFLGQSNIKLNFGPISAGLSNENIWWGPGIANALILSNNAPGFKHYTINTNRPIKTPVGYIEGQIIGGRLETSEFPNLFTSSLSNGTVVANAKSQDWRYFTGFNINYHPKWIPGLTLGLTRTFNAYGKDINGFSGYFPFFTPYAKANTTGGAEDGGIGDPFPRDQYTSVYARWLFTKAQAELYFEYGLNDNSYNITDFVQSPDHSRAYLIGLRKMISINGRDDQHILFGGEITQLSQSVDRLVRDAGGWYMHSEVKEGHTNQGQALGAGTGSGGNLQTVNVSWVSGLKKIGISVERYEHDVDYQNTYFADIGNNSRKWVDFAFGMQGEWIYKNFLFNAKLQHIKSLNYQWILKGYDPSKYYIPNNDVYNFRGELGITFRF